jgi:hypothetical protein
VVSEVGIVTNEVPRLTAKLADTLGHWIRHREELA